MKNKDLRDYAKSKAVKLWEIADKLGICEMTMTRKLRYELSTNETERIIMLIDEIAKEREDEQ